MAKSTADVVFDAALNYVKNNGSRITVCNAQPTTYTEAITTFKLADVDITSGDYTGPADGDVSGRKVTVNAQAGVTVDTTGTATHVAIVDVSNTALLIVTTCTSQAIVGTSTIDIPAWDIEIEDPT
jgi:hypothetical protein